MTHLSFKAASQSALALVFALLWGLVEFVALSRSRWLGRSRRR